MLLTRNANQDNLSDADYRDMYDELRTRLSYNQLASELGVVSGNAWRKYELGELALSRAMRNALRRYMGEPELPAPVVDAVEGNVDPDAAVYKRCDGPATVVTLTNGTGHNPGYKRSGFVSVSRATAAQNEKRQALGASWGDVIEAGLRTLEAMDW